MFESTCPQCQMVNANSSNYCGRCGATLDDSPIIVSKSEGVTVGGYNLPARQLRQVGVSVVVSVAALLAEVGVIYLNRRVQQMKRDSAVASLTTTRQSSLPAKQAEIVPMPEPKRPRTVTVMSERIVEVRRFGRPVQRMIERIAWRSEE